MKTEQQIKDEIMKHKKSIVNTFENRTENEKISSWIISALEWVLKE